MTTSSQTAAFNNPTTRIDDSSRFPTHHRWNGVGAGQWGAVVAGAVTGIAAGVLMATLGAALGLTATAAAADSVSTQSTTAEGVGQAVVGFSIGAGIWLLVSAAVVGLVGGTVLAKTSTSARAYSPGAHGVLTWSLGVALAAMFAVSGSGTLTTALGVGAAGAAGAAANSPGVFRSADVGASGVSTIPGSNEVRADGTRPTASRTDRDAAPSDAGFGRRAPAMTPAERDAAVYAAEVAATAAATAAWFALISLVVGLGATVGAASRRKFQAETELGYVRQASAF